MARRPAWERFAKAAVQGTGDHPDGAGGLDRTVGHGTWAVRLWRTMRGLLAAQLAERQAEGRRLDPGAGPRRPLDLRLIPAVAACWLAALAGCAMPWQTDRAVSLVLGAAAVAAMALLFRTSRQWLRPAMPVVLAVLCAAAVVSSTATALESRQRGPLAGAIAAGADIGAVVEIDSEARVAGGAEGRFLVDARIQEATWSGRRISADTPVLLIGGSSWAQLQRGSRIRLAGGLRAAEQADRHAAYFTAKTNPLALEPPTGWQGTTAAVRQGWADAAQRVWGNASRDVVGLLRGMVVGERTAQPPELSAAMKTAGLTHLTAVSGANCTIVMAAVVLLARSLRMPRAPAAALACLGLVGFAAVVGPDPSVLRAAVMGALGAAAMLSGRPRRIGAWLAAAVLVLLVADPWLATDFAFVLSVLATLGLLLVGQRMARWLGIWLPLWLAQSIAVPLAAQLLCAPVIVLLSPQLALYAVPANMVAAPVVALVTVAGTAGLGLAPALPWLADACAAVAGVGAFWVGATARTAAGLPGAALPWPEGAVGAALMAGLSVVLFGSLWVAVNRRRLAPALARVRHAIPSWASGLLGFPMVAGLAAATAGAVAWILSSA